MQYQFQTQWNKAVTALYLVELGHALCLFGRVTANQAMYIHSNVSMSREGIYRQSLLSSDTPVESKLMYHVDKVQHAMHMQVPNLSRLSVCLEMWALM